MEQKIESEKNMPEHRSDRCRRKNDDETTYFKVHYQSSCQNNKDRILRNHYNSLIGTTSELLHLSQIAAFLDRQLF